jgi:hypothetical protein
MSNGLVDRELVLALEALAKRFPFDVGHHVIEKPSDLAGVEERKYVRVIQSRDDSDLSQEPVGPHGLRQSGVEDFYRDYALVLDVLRETHCSHATAPKLAVDRVRRSE